MQNERIAVGGGTCRWWELLKIQVGKSKQGERSIKRVMNPIKIPLGFSVFEGVMFGPRTLPGVRKWLFSK